MPAPAIVRGPKSLAGCLPATSDPDFPWVLTELVRSDLADCPPAARAARLDQYRAEYPGWLDESVFAHGLFPDATQHLSATPLPVQTLSRTRLTPVDPVTDSPDSDPRTVRFPGLGDVFAGFRLKANLGSGAFGRVFLAEQVTLADRPVALKVTTRPTAEPDRLAKLRHTNIVPIHSVHSVGPFQAVCMPYLGKRTLSDLAEELRAGGAYPAAKPRTAAHASTRVPARTLTDTLPQPSGERPRPDRQPDPAPATPRAAVDRVVGVVAKLARGLAHAHDRGILHLDLKPANALLADDGEPLLLDFNLAYDRAANGRARTGGTIAYMAPEQLDDFADGFADHVTERTDLYALGVMLYELLTGVHPFPAPPGRPDLARLAADRRAGASPVRSKNQAVPPSLAAVVHKLLAGDPEHRYPTADALADDLERHLADRPLATAGNPSPLERLAKWKRRNPRAAVVVMLSLILAVAGTTGAGVVGARAAAAAMTAKAQADAVRADLAELRVDLCARDDAAARAGARQRAVALLADHGLPGGRADAVGRDLPDGVRAGLRADLAEVALLLAHADWLTARSGQSESEQTARAGLAWVAVADGLTPAHGPAAADARRALSGPARTVPPADTSGAPTAAGLYLTAARLIAENRPALAVPHLEAVVVADPDHAAAHLALAVCHGDLGRTARAVERLLSAKALAPRDPRPCHCRALLLLRQNDTAGAAAEVADALARDPNYAPTVLLRAALRLRAGDAAGAAADADRALAVRPDDISALYLRAMAADQLRDPAKAAAARAAAEAATPSTAADFTARGTARATGKANPAGAVLDLARAADLSPYSHAAWHNLAFAYSELLDQPGLALAAADRAIETAPDLPGPRGGRAVLHARRGDRKAARADADAAVALAPGDGPTALQAASAAALTLDGTPADEDRALAHLRTALRTRGVTPSRAETDADLAALRESPRFRELLAAARALADD